MEFLLQELSIPRSTFFYHQKRLGDPDKYAQLKEEIVEIYNRSRERYGYRRVYKTLRNDGRKVNNKLVRRLMREMGLKSKARRPKKYNSYRGEVSKIAPHVLERRFTPEKPNEVWVSDVTEFRVGEKKVYLSPIMDLHDRSILAYRLNVSPTVAFTVDSLKDAVKKHNPDSNTMVHTDQGFQYQHINWRNVIDEFGGTQSMSRKGNCHDNAVMENFFGHLKSEMFHGESFGSIEDLCAEIDEYIEWYNNERIQLGLDGLSPTQYRIRSLQQK